MIKQWSDISSEPMSLEAVQKLHLPNKHFRISYDSYDAGVASNGYGLASIVYALTGSCRYTVEETGEIIEVKAGEYAELPATKLSTGGLQFEILGEQKYEHIDVFEFPDEFKRIVDAEEADSGNDNQKLDG